jgi:hypothetical protein
VALLGFGVVQLSGPAAAIAPAPSAPSIKNVTGSVVVGKSKTVHIVASGFPKPTFTESGALPAGLTFTSGLGSASITGTPAAGTGNDWFFDVTATNTQGSDTETFDLTVFQPPVFPANFCPATMTVGQYSHDDEEVIAYPPFFGLGENNPTPSGVSYTQSTSNEDAGVLSGTPEPGSGGRYGLQYSSDANNTTRNVHCKLVVNEAPAFTDTGTATVTVGVAPPNPVSIGGTTGYPKLDAVSESGPAPVGMKMRTVHNGKGFAVTLSGPPASGTQGDYEMNVSSGNGLTSSENFVLVVQAAGVTPQPTTLALTPGTTPVTYQSSAQTYTATVNGGTSPNGFVQFSYGSGTTTVPLAGGQASFSTPANLDAGTYTITATYTGDALNSSSTNNTPLTVSPAPTTLTLTPSSTSVAFGTPVTYTATVACSPSCGGQTPTGNVDFVQVADAGLDTAVELVNGQATFTTDSALNPGLANEVDVTFSSYSDAPADFAATTPAVQSFYDIGAVNLVTTAEDTTASTSQAVTNGGTVTVAPGDTNVFSVQMSAAVSGHGVPPGPLNFDISEQAAPITATGCTLGASAPSSTVTGCTLAGVQVGDVVTDSTTPANVPVSPPTTVVSLSPVTLSTTFNSTITGQTLTFTAPVIDETSAAGVTNPSESAPSADLADGLTDYFWTIPAGGLSNVSGTSATVTISYAGSTDFAATVFTFTLDW